LHSTNWKDGVLNKDNCKYDVTLREYRISFLTEKEHKAVVAMMSVGIICNVGASIAYGMSVFTEMDLKPANGASMAGGKF